MFGGGVGESKVRIVIGLYDVPLKPGRVDLIFLAAMTPWLCSHLAISSSVLLIRLRQRITPLLVLSEMCALTETLTPANSFVFSRASD